MNEAATVQGHLGAGGSGGRAFAAFPCRVLPVSPGKAGLAVALLFSTGARASFSPVFRSATFVGSVFSARPGRQCGALPPPDRLPGGSMKTCLHSGSKPPVTEIVTEAI